MTDVIDWVATPWGSISVLIGCFVIACGALIYAMCEPHSLDEPPTVVQVFDAPWGPQRPSEPAGPPVTVETDELGEWVPPADPGEFAEPALFDRLASEWFTGGAGVHTDFGTYWEDAGRPSVYGGRPPSMNGRREP